jgi:acetyl esterase/lipase
MLYIHGGAWVMGSPLSHRAITTRFASLIGGAVFSLDYRLLPEHRRRDGIVDCQNAYRQLLVEGPGGRGSPSLLYVGGDSAGGNLALALAAWVRDSGLRAPDALIALSPATDGTFASPSMRSNVASDAMLGPQFGKLTKVPNWLLWWLSWFNNRIPPSDPEVSPAFGDLSRLPPTLVHASEAEMLLDDARRYVNKARAHGSPVTLQTWPHMVHVWHFFEASLPEADEAFEQIRLFLQREGSLPGQPA